MKQQEIFLKNPLVKNNPNEPFVKDYSGKLEGFARNLTAFVEGKAKERPLVISLSAPYGMGKTAFIDMWGQQLVNEEKIVIKYDAWQADYSETPLLSILAAINDQLCFFINEKKLLDEIKKSGFKLGVKCLPAIMRFIVSASAECIGISDSFKSVLDEFSELSSKDEKKLISEISKNTNKEVEKFILKEIESHKVKEKTINDFKCSISNIFKNDKSKVLFFLVDELDRCKPTFALQVLEAIKHFFDINNVCFVLISNQKVLFDMFRKTYGHSFESEDYFERFIDRHITLPDPDLNNFIDYRIEQTPIIRDCRDNNKLFRHVIYGCCNIFKFSFREFSKYLSDITDFIATNESIGKGVPDIYLPAVAYLLALKRKNPSACNEIIKARKIPGELEVSAAIKMKIWPIESLSELEKNVLQWSMRFLLSSNNIESLSVSAHELNETVKKMQNRDLSQPQHAHYQSLISLEQSLTHDVYDGFMQNTRKNEDFYVYRDKDYVHVKKHTQHLELATQIIDFLTPLEICNTGS